MRKYNIKYSTTFERNLKKLDVNSRKRILNWIAKHLYNTHDPRLLGKPLTGSFSNFWRYRIGDYRLLVEIIDKDLIIFAVDIGHRKNIYR